jgi:hypothetical protein
MADNPVKVNAEPPAKLVDFYTDPQYDRRVILFYDVLGWRNEIEIAGKQSEKIGDLRRLILQGISKNSLSWRAVRISCVMA